MVDSSKKWKEKFEVSEDPILSVVDELKASVEEEYWNKLQGLVEEITWSAEFRKNNSSLERIEDINSIDRWLISLEVDNDITTLNEEVTIRIKNEELLNEYKKEEFITLQENTELQLAEIKAIKDELEDFKKLWWELLDNTEVAVYLHDKYPLYYTRYIDTIKSKIAYVVEKKTKEYREFYDNIPLVSSIYNAIEERANPLEINV